MNAASTQSGTALISSNGSAPPVTSIPGNPVPTSMLSFRFATPNNTQTPYYISSDIVLSGGIAQQNRRRIVHNEVEKRRKDKITNWIKKLADLLPRHRVTKQSKNYVLETACEYIEELNQMSSQFNQLKLSKDILEQEVTELRNKVNKLEDENKRLSQLIHQNKVSLPSTWSDSSLITTAMRATSSPRNSTYPQCRPSIGSNVNEASRSFHSTPTATIMSTVTNCLSVTSILSSHSKEQVTTTNSRQRNDERQITTLPVNEDSQALTLTNKRPLNAVAKTSSGAKSTNRISNNTSRQSNPLATTRRSSSAAVPSTSTHLASLIPKATEVSRVTPSNTIGQASFMPQSQTAMILSVANMTGMEHLPHQQTDTAETSSVDKAFSQAQQMRSIGSNSVQGSISQLPYSIDALTGNHSSHNRQQATTTGNPLNFSAESLIGRQETSSDIALVNNPVNQPVIQNTFTLTHRNSLINGNSTPTTAAPQSFSNFSALSLVGNTDTFSVNASSSTRSSTTGQDSGAIPPSTGNIFTDFSTESLIGQTEFTSDFAIDNLISRSDSSAHMATINPNLIQSFGKGSDPMISSVSGDHANHLAHNFDPPGFNIGTFTSHLFPPYW